MNCESFLKIIIMFLGINFMVTAQEIKIGNYHTIEFKEIEVEQNENSVYVKALIRSNGKDSLDINAFSLLDTVNKIRYRMCSFRAAKGSSNVGFGHMDESYLKTNLLTSKGKRYSDLPRYNPSYPDSFDSYVFDGYESCESIRYFGTNHKHSFNELFVEKKDLYSSVYFPCVKPKYKKFVCWFTFPLNDIEIKPGLVLYHGKNSVKPIK